MLWAYLYFYQITLDTHQESGLSPVDSAHLEIPSSPVIVYCEKTNHVVQRNHAALQQGIEICLLYTSPSPRDS